MKYEKFTVEKGKSYQALLRLTGIETWATNEMLMEKFEELGFNNVRVTGSGEERDALGTWSEQTTTVDLPKQVVRAEEVKIIFDETKKKSDEGDQDRSVVPETRDDSGEGHRGEEIEDDPWG